jgi:hypothetical protein
MGDFGLSIVNKRGFKRRPNINGIGGMTPLGKDIQVMMMSVFSPNSSHETNNSSERASISPDPTMP